MCKYTIVPSSPCPTELTYTSISLYLHGVRSERLPPFDFLLELHRAVEAAKQVREKKTRGSVFNLKGHCYIISTIKSYFETKRYFQGL